MSVDVAALTTENQRLRDELARERQANHQLGDSTPLIAGLALYFGSDDTKVYAVDIQKFRSLGPYSGTALKQGYAILNGEELWTYTADAEVRSTPAAANGVVYFTGFDGYLYAVR